MVEDKLVSDLLWQMVLQTQHAPVLLHFLLLELVNLQLLYVFVLILISSFLRQFFPHCSQYLIRLLNYFYNLIVNISLQCAFLSRCCSGMFGTSCTVRKISYHIQIFDYSGSLSLVVLLSYFHCNSISNHYRPVHLQSSLGWKGIYRHLFSSHHRKILVCNGYQKQVQNPAAQFSYELIL